MANKKYILLFASLLVFLILLSSCGTGSQDVEALEDDTTKMEEATKNLSVKMQPTQKNNDFEKTEVIKHLIKTDTEQQKLEASTEKAESEDKESTAKNPITEGEKVTTVASTEKTSLENTNTTEKSIEEKTPITTKSEPSNPEKSTDKKSKNKSVEPKKDEPKTKLKEEPKKEPKKEETVEKPKKEETKKVVLDIPYVNQYSPTYAPFGCEGASLLMALKYKTGTTVGLKQFLVDMPKDPKNPYNGFASSPFKVVKGVFQSIFPAPLTAYGKKYRSGVANISGSSVTNLKAELDKGNPIVVFVTLDFATPTWSEWDMGYEAKKNIVDNMHVVVLTGYNSKGSYHVTDPAGRGKYWVSKSRFENAYNALRWAVVVR